jgi:hypothetical protein
VAVALFVVSWVVGLTRERWGTPHADGTHTYPVLFRGRRTLFFTPPLGWLLDHFLWIYFALLVPYALVEWRSRRRRGKTLG